MSTIINGTDNSATTPAITGSTGGTSTGVFYPASNQVALATNGTTAVTIDTSQNVGIGTASPVTKLNVVQSTAADAIIRLSNTNAGVYASTLNIDAANATGSRYNSLYSSNGGTYQWSISGGGADSTMAFGTGSSNTERMRIGSNGYVAIGTASPSNEAMLHIKATSSAFPQLQLVQDNASDGWNLNATSAGGQLNFQRKGSGGTNTVAYYDTAGSLILSGPTGQKSTGTTWSNPSDSRLKENVTDYTKGLSELNQVNVKTWEYNGKAGTTAGSKGLGVIADEIMQVLPETVDTYEAKLNAEDEEVTDVKRFDATEITWLLVNAVKELNAKVEAQATTIAELQAKVG